jgi:hypothetical protein
MKVADKFKAFQKHSKAGEIIPYSIKDEPARFAPFEAREVHCNKSGALIYIVASDANKNMRHFAAETWRFETI